MEGFESVFPELEEKELPEEATTPSEETPETIEFKHDHRRLQLPLSAVQAIGDMLGQSPEEAVATLQKGCNYDRLRQRAEDSTGIDLERALHTERGWIELFMEHRDIEPADITEEMYSAVEEGRSPREVLLEMRLKRAEDALKEERSRALAAAKSPGSMADALPEEPKDDFERAFEKALRMH